MCQAACIMLTNADLLSVKPLGPNYSETWNILISIQQNVLQNTQCIACKMCAILSRLQWDNATIFWELCYYKVIHKQLK